MEAIDPYHKEFVQFLDGARTVPSVQEQKRIILEMLSLQLGESESECKTWLEQLEQAGRAGHFFMSTNHYIVCGRNI